MPSSVNGFPIGAQLATITAGDHSCRVAAGDIATILQYCARQWDKHVEPIETLYGYRSAEDNRAIGGDAGSNHISGTAIDINGALRPYEPHLVPAKRGAAYALEMSAEQLATMRRILASVAPVVQWGWDYPRGLRDPMHLQIRHGVTAAQLEAVAARITAKPTSATTPLTPALPVTPIPAVAPAAVALRVWEDDDMKDLIEACYRKISLFAPSDDELAEVQVITAGLTRPEVVAWFWAQPASTRTIQALYERHLGRSASDAEVAARAGQSNRIAHDSIAGSQEAIARRGR